MPLNIAQVQDGQVRVIDALGNVVSDFPLSLLAREASLLALTAIVGAGLDVPLSSRASEATLLAINALLLTRATEATLLTRLSKADFEARINTLGQKTSALSTPVVLPSDQTVVVSTTPINSRRGVSTGTRTLGAGTAGLLFAVEATPYVEPAAQAQRSIVSTNANDTAAGTGARTVRITYYDNTGAGPFTEIIALNGLVPVNTVAVNIRFIEKMETVTVGTVGGGNLGVISLFTGLGGAGTVIGTIGFGTISPGSGDYQTFWGHHYVALGSTCLQPEFNIGSTGGGASTIARFTVRTFFPLVPNSIELAMMGATLINGSFERTYQYGPITTGFARLKIFVVPQSNNTLVTGTFDWSETP